MERCSRGDTRGQEKGGGDGWTLNQEEIQGSSVTICSQHFMIAQVLSVKLSPSNSSTYEDNSKYLLHVPPWEGTFTSRKLFFILTKNRVCNGFSFFSSYRNRKSQKTAENPAFQGHLPKAACPTEGHSHNRCVRARCQPGKPGLFCNIRSYSG